MAELKLCSGIAKNWEQCRAKRSYGKFCNSHATPVYHETIRNKVFDVLNKNMSISDFYQWCFKDDIEMEMGRKLLKYYCRPDIYVVYRGRINNDRKMELLDIMEIINI